MIQPNAATTFDIAAIRSLRPHEIRSSPSKLTSDKQREAASHHASTAPRDEHGRIQSRNKLTEPSPPKTIIDLIDQHYPEFNEPSWAAWRVFFEGPFAPEMSDAERAIFRRGWVVIRSGREMSGRAPRRRRLTNRSSRGTRRGSPLVDTCGIFVRHRCGTAEAIDPGFMGSTAGPRRENQRQSDTRGTRRRARLRQMQPWKSCPVL